MNTIITIIIVFTMYLFLLIPDKYVNKYIKWMDEKRELRPEDYPKHECFWLFIDNEDDEYEKIKCCR